MTRIKPFTGIRYAKGVAQSVNDLLAPPYDVISPAQQEALYARHPKNVVRLILGRQFDTDTDADNRYTRSAATLAAWKAEGTLLPDDAPALYLYAQDFLVEGVPTRRTGFICRRLVDNFGDTIHPHERTLAGPKLDRLLLTRACRTNFSQVFSIYRDESQTLDRIWSAWMEKNNPDITVIDDEGEGHHLWSVTDPAVIGTVEAFFENRDLVIADGHHRYTTAINYRQERREADGNPPQLKAYDYCMMFIANTAGPGFTILPTHRVVMATAGAAVDGMFDRLGGYFSVSRTKVTRDTVGAFVERLKKAGQTAPSFGLYTGNGEMALLTFTGKKKYLADMAAVTESETLKLLDVSILQNLVLENILGITREKVANKKDVTFTIDPKEVMERVDREGAVAGFLMNATDVGQVYEVATGGGVMPQKSTYFYPKLITGLVMNPID
ncbi:MAG: DUF1015 domain-containing protein [Nitrospinae bacterium]|nr:DUF1015 domain-containing protein [Nitrospinota bacterium]